MPLYKRLRLSYPNIFLLFGATTCVVWRRDKTAVFLSVTPNYTHMANTKQTRKLAPWQLRRALAQLADEICIGREPITVNLSGNTFEIHIDDISINITVNQKGGAQ